MQAQNQILSPEQQKQRKVCKIIIIIILLGSIAFSIAMLVEGDNGVFFVGLLLTLFSCLSLICFNCQNTMQADDDQNNLFTNFVNKNNSNPFYDEQTELNYKNRDMNEQFYQNFNGQPQYYQQNLQYQQTQFIPQNKQNIIQKLATQQQIFE